jgi:Protein of unknown function (DUF3237)
LLPSPFPPLHPTPKIHEVTPPRNPQLDPATNVSHLDVRTQGRTSDGEAIYVHYSGVLKVDETTGNVLAWSKDAKSTEYGDHEWFSGPIIETSSQKFKWVETTLFVGQGALGR